MKGAPFVKRRYTKGIPFLLKMVYKIVRQSDLGAEVFENIPQGLDTFKKLVHRCLHQVFKSVQELSVEKVIYHRFDMCGGSL